MGSFSEWVLDLNLITPSPMDRPHTCQRGPLPPKKSWVGTIMQLLEHTTWQLGGPCASKESFLLWWLSMMDTIPSLLTSWEVLVSSTSEANRAKVVHAGREESDSGWLLWSIGGQNHLKNSFFALTKKAAFKKKKTLVFSIAIDLATNPSEIQAWTTHPKSRCQKCRVRHS